MPLGKNEFSAEKPTHSHYDLRLGVGISNIEYKIIRIDPNIQLVSESPIHLLLLNVNIEFLEYQQKWKRTCPVQIWFECELIACVLL